MSERLAALLVCEGASLDVLSGRLTAFNMLEVIGASQFPTLLSKIVIITLYEDCQVGAALRERVRIVGPDGTEANEASSSTLQFSGDHHRSIYVLNFVKLLMVGVHKIIVETSLLESEKWTIRGSRRVQVQDAPQVPGASAPSPPTPPKDIH